MKYISFKFELKFDKTQVLITNAINMIAHAPGYVTPRSFLTQCYTKGGLLALPTNFRLKLMCMAMANIN